MFLKSLVASLIFVLVRMFRKAHIQRHNWKASFWRCAGRLCFQQDRVGPELHFEPSERVEWTGSRGRAFGCSPVRCKIERL